uniref:Conserved hypothetical phage tail region protein n=1 Tax=Candidatus Kentrum sp. SD TaxID=2126332 RepID=A0A451BHP3_9GAMM|nr:MAG: conserved hypothetical phage tail region protein [Candidatus Kentron sp. SD]VFK39165.1 MAG: conserved hypothetical phage tail region protein [Candidatus Kentron sp. SD]VFK77811.1 MAG: conserved hypothetical phage tail region protein [Candidatus Kentron sp. SD]
MEIPGPLGLIGNPPLGFRFSVFFFAGGVVPNPLDTLFQKVSGLSWSIETTQVEEGGQNLFSHRLPERVQYDNLVLERGLVVGSPLASEFETTMSDFRFAPSNVLVTLLDDAGAPVAAWLFRNAWPVAWSVSDLDAMENEVVIETMELAYQRMQPMRV